MRRVATFGFTSDLDLPALRDRLNEGGSGSRWIDRDSDRHGAYISTRVPPHGAFYKVFMDPDDRRRYVVTIQLDDDRGELATHFVELERTALDRVLPSIGARDVARRESLD